MKTKCPLLRFGFRISGFIFCALFVFGVEEAHADAVSLPLKGYFHPGRAMPVRWDISSGKSADGIIQLSASGAITSLVQWAGNPHGIFPWLVIDRNVRDIRWRLPDGSGGSFSSLHPLEDSDWLVASTLNDDSAAGSLFRGRRVILLHLPSGMDGPAMAWETLDAILLTPEALTKISSSVRGDLFAAGVELAVMGEARPDGILPWQHSGPWWLASANLRLAPMVDSDAYAPTYGWVAGRSAEFRRHIFLLGAIYCLIVAGIALWRSRWMAVAIVAASILAGFVFASENRKSSPIFRRGGVVRLIDGSALKDDWVYQVSHRDADFRMPVEDSVRPVFFSLSQLRTMNLAMDCGDSGQPVAISGRLSADEPLALMHRRLSVKSIGGPLVAPATTPLRLLAADPMYRGFAIAGQVSGVTPDDSWPTLILKRTNPTQP
ncbi:MAG TPA: hypothetical protein VHX86_02820 [Tepidisphaeraceae bacterium]|jgi:hypothetical protein|nr:hypothetical protein [Tepidisphaeraceae bacterium]